MTNALTQKSAAKAQPQTSTYSMITGERVGGARRDRTDDLLLAKQIRHSRTHRKRLILLDYPSTRYNRLSPFCKVFRGLG